MNIPERKLRVGGYFVFAGIFFCFFMLEMFFSWRDEYMLPKVAAITVLHTLFIWEPTRFLILLLRKRLPGIHLVKRRLALASGVLVPYAFLLGFLRIFLEDYTNLWGVPVANITNFSITIGITFLFVMLQLAVYESVYFFGQWNKSLQEAEALRRVNMLVQMDSLKLQVQPHFLFNTLNTLIGLIETDQQRAVRFTEDLAYVYRYLLESTEKTLIALDVELDFARRYFSLLKTRYPEGLHLVESIDNTRPFKLPPLSLQILIENAVKHNKLSRRNPLFIEISFDPVGQRIAVSNNLQPKNLTGTTGKGLQNLKKKFQLLNLPDMKVYLQPNRFIVSFPLVKKQNYESIDH